MEFLRPAPATVIPRLGRWRSGRCEERRDLHGARRTTDSPFRRPDARGCRERLRSGAFRTQPKRTDGHGRPIRRAIEPPIPNLRHAGQPLAARARDGDLVHHIGPRLGRFRGPLFGVDSRHQRLSWGRCRVWQTSACCSTATSCQSAWLLQSSDRSLSQLRPARCSGFKRRLLGLQLFDQVRDVGGLGLLEKRHGARGVVGGGRSGVGAESSAWFTGEAVHRTSRVLLLA